VSTVILCAADSNLKSVPKTVILNHSDYGSVINGCPTVIDRQGQSVESYSENSEWFIYGIPTRCSKADFEDYVTVQGDGYYEIQTIGNRNTVGTGSTVNVYDRNGTDDLSDDTLVETFYVVVWGDYNGDGSVSSLDGSLYLEEYNGEYERTKPDSDTYSPAILKTADMNKDGKFNEFDVDAIYEAALGASQIHMQTGLLIKN
jgi:hypothetical protein